MLDVSKKKKNSLEQLEYWSTKRYLNSEVREIFKRLGLYGDIDGTSKKTTNDITAELKKLKKLLDDGVINNKEFEQAKEKILN